LIEETMNNLLRLLLPLSMAAALSTAALSTTVFAADVYPTKPIRLIVPFTAGGAADVVGRLIAGKLSERLGRPMIVDNRTGAGGVIGTDMVAKATPDGYTLAFVPASFTMQPALQKLPYDAIKSFIPVSRVGKGAFVLVVNPSVPASTLKEFIAHVKQNPGKLFFGTAGAGSTAHMFIELFKLRAGVDFNVVHFKGGNQQVTDMLGGHTHGTMISLPAVRPHIVAGKLRALGTTALQRSVFLPDVPTIAEAAIPGFETIVWWGMLAPRGTPAPVVARLDSEIKAALGLDDVRKMFATQGVEPDYLGSAGFAPFIAGEISSWTRVVEKGNIKLE
jgi:tripartite-type tricarboxylate transporter receptor subunit TctC